MPQRRQTAGFGEMTAAMAEVEAPSRRPPRDSDAADRSARVADNTQ